MFSARAGIPALMWPRLPENVSIACVHITVHVCVCVGASHQPPTDPFAFDSHAAGDAMPCQPILSDWRC